VNASLLMILSSLPVVGAPLEAGFICRPAYSVDDQLRGPLGPYHPQPGDMVFVTDRRVFWHISIALALSGHPHHVGIVVAQADGRLAILEAGAHYVRAVELKDVVADFHQFEQENSPIWIRRRKTPLTAEESAALTSFATAVDDRPYAVVRLGGQLTPFRSRAPLRTGLMGKPRGEDRRGYFCSECIMEALVAAGLVDRETTRPAATYPRDMFFDRSPNPFLKKHLNLSSEWEPPARWVSAPKLGGTP
jgi:hypothetical protein